ncbi:MAG: HAD family hydrolase [Candidatus Bathyarchaeota archaeon]|nr:HAD family hydrolase [Candidatus Bathyarchaeota archaeon]
MRVKAVIFDLDGTLANFNLDYKTVRAEVKGYLVKRGVPASVLSVKESVFEMLRKTEIYVKNSAKPAKFFNDIRSEALAMAEKYELEAAKSTSLLPGAMETLKALRRMGLKIGLCTINSENAVNYILTRFGIADYFGVTVSRNKVNQYKPNPEHIGAALRALDVSASDAVIVGDGSVDMQSAKELDAIAVGLPTGVSTMEQLMRSGANYVITSITDLPLLIEKINKASSSAEKE